MKTLDQWKQSDNAEFRFVADDLTAIVMYRAPYGDFVKAYMEHLAMPWWRRWGRWKKIETRMREILNERPEVFWVERKNRE